MHVEVRFLGLESCDAHREHAARQVHFRLSRFGGEVTAVVVRISDLNGPKGGVDKRCQLTVRGPKLGLLVLDERGTDTCSTVDLAVERVGRSIGRELRRLRSGKRVDVGRPVP